MDKHELGNMIYCLENKKNLKNVIFTKSAVAEILGYLKELQIKAAEIEKLKTDLEFSNNFENKQLLIDGIREASEIIEILKKQLQEKNKELSILKKALEICIEKKAEFSCPDQPDRYDASEEYGCDSPYYIYEGGCENSDHCDECAYNYFLSEAEEVINETERNNADAHSCRDNSDGYGICQVCGAAVSGTTAYSEIYGGD